MPINACDACGWTAAFCSMLAFGSFGVPIKSKVRYRQLGQTPNQANKATTHKFNLWVNEKKTTRFLMLVVKTKMAIDSLFDLI